MQTTMLTPLQRSQQLYDMISDVPWYQGKLDMQAYLREINKDKKASKDQAIRPDFV